MNRNLFLSRRLIAALTMLTILFALNIAVTHGQDSAPSNDGSGGGSKRPAPQHTLPPGVARPPRQAPTTGSSSDGVATAVKSSGTVPQSASNGFTTSTAGPQTATVFDPVRSEHYAYQLYPGAAFSDPFMMTFDNATSYLYVSDFFNKRIVVFNAFSGVQIGAFSIGTGEPEGSAVVGSTLFVADALNHVILLYDKTSFAFLGSFGSLGSGAGQLNTPIQIAFNPLDGLLYVVERVNNRVQRFTTAGVTQGTFGSLGTGPGQLSNPFGVAVDSQGFVYVGDTGNNRIMKFTTTGTFVRQISGPGSAAGLLSGPLALAVDRANMIYVIDRDNVRIQKFDWQGNFRGIYGALGPACGGLVGSTCNGFFSSPRGIAVSNQYNAQPTVFVSDGTLNTVQAFKASMEPVSHNFQGVLTGYNSPFGVAVDSAENFYVADSGNNLIEKYNKYGNFLTSWGSSGTGNGQFNFPYGITIDSSDVLYVTDTGNNRFQKFDTAGNFLGAWGSFGTGNGQFNHPSGLTYDAGYLYITDEVNHRVQKFDTAGNWIRQWGSNGTANGQFINPAGIAVDSARGLVYVAEYNGNRIQTFTLYGDFVNVVADSVGVLSHPVGLMTDQRGNLYVADRGNDRIVQYNDNGQYVSQFGSTGSANGQFTGPNALAYSVKSGLIYTLEEGTNQRLQRWGSPNPKVDTVGVWHPATRQFFLKNTNATGFADINDQIGWSQTTDIPVVGDWNGDGIDSVGLYRSSTGVFFLVDNNRNGPATFDYGVVLGNPGDTPLAGDWNADGYDTAGVFRPSNGLIYIKNTLTTGFADYVMVLGNPGDQGIAGDWNGDGQDTPGVYRPSVIRFYLSDYVQNGVTFADHVVLLGDPNDLAFAGDWIHQGSSGIGTFRAGNGFIYLKNDFIGIFADTNIFYGVGGDKPIAGYWGPVPYAFQPPPINTDQRSAPSILVQPGTSPVLPTPVPSTPVKAKGNGGQFD